jgi:hypothetical protein
MNERIKKLSLAASDTIPDDASVEHALYLFQKNFAELIIRECSVFLKDTLDDHFAAEQLEEHFGVEE